MTKAKIRKACAVLTKRIVKASVDIEVVAEQMRLLADDIDDADIRMKFDEIADALDDAQGQVQGAADDLKEVA